MCEQSTAVAEKPVKAPAPAGPAIGPDGKPLPEFDAQGRQIWRVGNLVYTKRGLVILFLWLLWIDFTFTLCRQWKRMGGREHFKPPDVGKRTPQPVTARV